MKRLRWPAGEKATANVSSKSCLASGGDGMKPENRRVTIPYHNQNLKRGTLTSIICQAGLTVAAELWTFRSVNRS